MSQRKISLFRGGRAGDRSGVSNSVFSSALVRGIHNRSIGAYVVTTCPSEEPGKADEEDSCD